MSSDRIDNIYQGNSCKRAIGEPYLSYLKFRQKLLRKL